MDTAGGLFGPGRLGGGRVIEGVAVDPSGTVWVSIYGPIYSFSDALENKYQSEVKPQVGDDGEGLGVDGEGNFYTKNGGSDFSPERKFAKVNRAGKY